MREDVASYVSLSLADDSGWDPSLTIRVGMKPIFATF